MIDNRSNAGPMILLGLLAAAAAAVVVYLLAAPRIDRATVNNVAYICASGPLLLLSILLVILGIGWLDSRRHARRREDEAMRQDVLYHRQQAAQQQSTDLAVLRQMTQVVEAGARAQLTAARTQHELARSAALLPPSDANSAWEIPANWDSYDD